jgi:tetratricopeptide (TPR) repeat protein
LPLLRTGRIEAAFPRGAGLENATAVRVVADALGTDAGLESSMPLLWTGLTGVEVGDDPNPSYPYYYPSLTAFQGALTANVLREHTDELVDLANLLTVASAAQRDDLGGSEMSAAIAGAQVIAEALAVEVPTCDVLLTRAWVVAIGESPSVATQDQVFKPALERCGDDPTARWLWGHRMLEDSAAWGAYIHDGTTREQALARPLELFEAWVENDPASALPHAGLADTLLAQSAAMRNAGVRPFTVRAYAARARKEYEVAIADSPQPEFLLGRARAAALHGDPDADELTQAAVAARPDSLAFLEHAADLFEARHDLPAAADAAARTATAVDRLRLVPTNADGAHPAWLGWSDATALTLRDATASEYGAGGVDWLGFLPDYRRNRAFVSTFDRDPSCRQHAQARIAYEEGDIATLQRLGSVLDAALPDCEYVSDARALADLAQYGYSESATLDDLQNFWRYAGHYDWALATIQSWQRGQDDLRSYERLGEVQFLRKQWPDAEAALEHARAGADGAPLMDGTTWTWVDSMDASLMLGLTQEKAGADQDAMETYLGVVATFQAAIDPPLGSDADYVAAQERVGSILLQLGRSEDALPYLQAAAEGALAHDKEAREFGFDILETADPLSSGAEYNNYSAVLLDLARDPGVAVEFAERATEIDPLSPVYEDTLAQAQEANGQTGEAKTDYDRAAAMDPSAYQTQNNRGILAAQRGDYNEAETALRAALAAKPDYALAWFNLGVVLGHSRNPADFLGSQAAVARAVRLDSSFRGAGAQLIADRSAVTTGLDVSRPISPGWTFASGAKSPMVGLSWVVLLLALLRLAMGLGIDQLGGAVGSRVLSDRWNRTRPWRTHWGRLNQYSGLVPGVMACGAVAAWPMLGSSPPGPWPAATLVMVPLALAWLYARAGAATLANPYRRGWRPGLIFGAVSAVVGYTFIPVPVDPRTTTSRRSRWAGAGMLAVVAIVGLGVGLLTGVPVVRLTGVTALAMFASALTPLRPFDGGFLASKRAKLAVSFVLLATSGALLLGWL